MRIPGTSFTDEGEPFERFSKEQLHALWQKEAADPRYVRFIERNTWERETWAFYIPLRGNEDALRILHKWLANHDETRHAFRVEFEPFSEREVEARCKSESGSYMQAHNHLRGKLDLTRIPGITATYLDTALNGLGFTEPKVLVGDLEKALYKGGIQKLMIAP